METKKSQMEKPTFRELLDQINKQADLALKQAEQGLEQAKQREKESIRMEEIIDRLKEARNQSTTANTKHGLNVVFRERKMILPYMLKPSPVHLRIVR
jgi:hypothetical protein